MVQKRKTLIELLTGASGYDTEEAPGSFFDDERPASPFDEPVSASPVEPKKELSDVAGSRSMSGYTWADAMREGQLTVDVFQNDQEVVIKSVIGGVRPQDLDVAINNDNVTIRGERRYDEQISKKDYYYQEIHWGKFSRSIILPVEINAEGASAELKNGVLTIRLPKKHDRKHRRLEVTGY